MRLAIKALSAGALAVLALALPAGAGADAPINGFDVTTTSTQAGGHPDLEVRIEVGTLATEGVKPCFCNAVKDLVVNTPAGLVGAPQNLVQCTASELVGNVCPIDSQVGVVAVRLFAPLDQGGAYFVQPLYNMVARPGQLALFGTVAPLLQTPIYTVVAARTESDYGLELTTSGLPRLIPPNEITQFTWGVPADPIHDPLRWPTTGGKSASCYNGNPLPDLAQNQFPGTDICGFGNPGAHSAINPPAPFLLNPTSCSGPLTATLDDSAYDLGTDHAQVPYPATTGCDQLSFNPSLAAQPTTTEADSPSGLNVDLKVPQTLSPNALSPSEIHATTVTLPPGFTLNPATADGKLSCSDTAAGFGTREQANCPDFAKIGTLTIHSSSLPGALPGAMYLGAPLPGDRYRVFLIADGFSLHIKLAGSAHPDPSTGQLSITFPDLPQTPFSEFDMHFFGAERGLLATPTHCGTYPVKSEFVPWAAELPTQTSTQFFTIDSGPGGGPCPATNRPFNPSLSAGVTNNGPGEHTTFGFDLGRPDGNQNVRGISVMTPPGFSAKLAGVPYCSEASLAAAVAAGAAGLAQLGAPICPQSLVGYSQTTTGAGSKPMPLPGNVYLAGPYKGAPLSLAVVTPAVAGPYDLGNVVVRVALNVDPSTARITATSDPLPQIVGGIPLRLREVRVVLNRPNFALNPTDCDPFAVYASATGDQGAVANLSAPFTIANCGVLDFKPKLNLRLSGATKRNGHPAIHATLKANRGDANISRVAVTLPSQEILDQAHLSAPCTRAQFAASACPASTVLGSAKATSPILANPLSGPVYLVTSSHALPDLVVTLKGQVDITLRGRIDQKNGGLRTTFADVPDVPVTDFRLNLQGGKKGLIVNSRNVCSLKSKAKVRMRGQNNRRANSRLRLKAKCGKGRHRRRGRTAHRQLRANVTAMRKAA